MKSLNLNNCLNCGNKIDDSKFCPNCGQINTGKRLSIKQVSKDVFGDYFSIDSKLFRSILSLFLKPGFLTMEYLQGRRNKYILPFRLYIFVTLLFFTIVALFVNLNQINIVQFEYDNIVENVTVDSSLMAIMDKHGQSVPIKIKKDIVDEIDSIFTLTKKPIKEEKSLFIDKDSTEGFGVRYFYTS